MCLEISVERILDEYCRWRSYDYSHEECMAALRSRDPNTLVSHASDSVVDEAIRLLDAAGDIYPERVRLTQEG